MSLAQIIGSAGLEGEWELGDEGEAFTATTSLPGGRVQRVSLRLARADDGKWVRVFSRIGRVETMSPQSMRRALAVNFEMLGGAIALHRDELVVMQSLLAQGMAEGELRAAVESVASLADQYERSFFGSDEH
ncbi:MAG: YbjN domain-containing protein [Thermoanaerobaculia bacterium]|nr:YbjN domain-containing protein [Thermoanaerobaculia bacterium]